MAPAQLSWVLTLVLTGWSRLVRRAVAGAGEPIALDAGGAGAREGAVGSVRPVWASCGSRQGRERKESYGQAT